jgi:hypothetical protein
MLHTEVNSRNRDITKEQDILLQVKNQIEIDNDQEMSPDEKPSKDSLVENGNVQMKMSNYTIKRSEGKKL